MVCRQRFQSTLPRWERQKTQPKHVRDNRFQSTLPRGERPPSFPARSRCCRYFNPRSREGSDMPELRLTCGKKISIHAPARGATATASVGFARFVNFNPRSREGSDDQLAKTIDDANKISIHAPARGATGLFLHSTWRSGFQSTLPRGERHPLINIHIIAHGFQSTLPRGERRIFRTFSNSFFVFQSTLPRGERRKSRNRADILL